MKSINHFLNKKQSNDNLINIFGGKIRDTGAHDDCGVYEDEWDDKDNDGKFSNGDTMCFNELTDDCA